MRILGVDPGTALTGYGVLDYTGSDFFLVESGCIRTRPGESPAKRLYFLYRQLEDIILRCRPQCLAVEELFFNRNARTALAVGQARGVVLLAAAAANLLVGEYTPLQVKQAVAGYGRADKAQVQFMVKTILGLSEPPRPDDVADALAVAICHAHMAGREGGR